MVETAAAGGCGDCEEEVFAETANPPTPCRDCDADCLGIVDKLHCLLLDPTQGYCPFLAGEMKDETLP